MTSLTQRFIRSITNRRTQTQPFRERVGIDGDCTLDHVVDDALCFMAVDRR